MNFTIGTRRGLRGGALAPRRRRIGAWMLGAWMSAGCVASGALLSTSAAQTTSTAASDPAGEATPTSEATPAQRLELEQLLAEHEQKDADTLRFLQGLARSHEAEERFEDAARVYAHLGGIFPDDPYWAFKTAQMHAFAGNLDEAILLARATRDRDPTDFDTGLLLARAYAWNGQWTQSEQVLIELEESHPGTPALLKSRGDLLYYQGRFAEARVQYERYLERRSQDPEALQALARCHLALGDVEKAEQLKAPLQEAGRGETAEQIEDVARQSNRRFRFDVAPNYSINAGRPDWFGARSTLTYQVNDAVNLGAGFELSSRRDIGSTNVMILLLGGFRIGSRLSLDTEFGFTPASDFRPRFMGRLIPRLAVFDWLDVFAFYQFMNFADGAGPGTDLWVHQIGPGIGLHFGPVSFDLSYRVTIFDQDELDLGHLGTLDMRIQVHPRWALLGSAAYGDQTEVFYDRAAAPAVPVIRDTLTLGGGVEYGITEWQGIRALYSFFTTDPPRRDPGGLYSHTITLHYWVKF